ncbi:MAG: 1-deoxy-D-xylulose-5-phosphate reductoisomerase [Actinomycetota bacterium]
MSSARRIAILGSTGSIGRQALDIVRSHPKLFTVVGLVAGRDADGLRRQVEEFGVTHSGLGSHAAMEIATRAEVDVVLNAIVGAAGLRATVAALGMGKTVALANKESLVAGGEVCVAAAAAGGGRIVPVDSEHAAIAQCLQGRDRESVERIILTASGGPFRSRPDLSSVTVEEALAHPTWNMGEKITVDSATMMNKGLEVVEAHHLFGFDYERIGVVVHPQSIVHGIVELRDSSLILQAAPTDMRIPIQAALTAPGGSESSVPPLDLETLPALEFEPVDRARFPAVDLAYEAGGKAQTYPAVLNAANEVAVRAFLDRTISFAAITGVIEEALAAHDPSPAHDLETVLEADEWAREHARRVVSLADEGSS